MKPGGRNEIIYRYKLNQFVYYIPISRSIYIQVDVY